MARPDQSVIDDLLFSARMRREFLLERLQRICPGTPLATVHKPGKHFLELVVVFFQQRANVVVAHGQAGSRGLDGVCDRHGLAPPLVVNNNDSKARAELRPSNVNSVFSQTAAQRPCILHGTRR